MGRSSRQRHADRASADRLNASTQGRRPAMKSFVLSRPFASTAQSPISSSQANDWRSTSWQPLSSPPPSRLPVGRAARCSAKSGMRTSSAATGCAPVDGEYRDEPHPGDRPADLRGRALRRPGHRAGARRRPRRQGRLGRDLHDRALEGAERSRRRDRGEPRDAGGRRELGERQAGARDARRRHPAGGRPLPLLRRRDPRRGGHDLRDRQGHRRLPLLTSRSAWSGRSSPSTSRC